MKLKQIITVICACALPIVMTAQESPDGNPTAPAPNAKPAAAEKPKMEEMSEEDMMKMWMEMISLGDEHKEMAKTAGTYTYTSKFWMDPEGEPTISTGKTTIEPTMDGRYMIEKHEGTTMGMPFTGMGISGYDKVNKEYVFTWMDNMGTGIMLFKGTKNSDGDLVQYSQQKNPMTGVVEVHKAVTSTTDDGMLMEYYVQSVDGSETKSMEVEYKKIGE